LVQLDENRVGDSGFDSFSKDFRVGNKVVIPNELPQAMLLQSPGYIQTPIIAAILRAKVGVFVELFKKAKQVEQQRAELQKRLTELTQTSRELEAFAYSLSHDLRAPLRAIHSFTKMVLDDRNQRLDATGTDFLVRVVSAAERIRLMQDLLTLGRVSHTEMRFKWVDVQRLIEELVSESESQRPCAEITVSSPLLPMLGDEASLTQCISNLLSNAVKFVAPGIVPQVRIYSQPLGDKVRLWVEDNGIGIQSEVHKKIFETFQRLPHDIKYEGEGIGLAIVLRAVDRMGGKVGLESEPGKGSRFWIELTNGEGTTGNHDARLKEASICR
jgi:signal transduction histidine kinase